MKTTELVFLKLGGSLITDKEKPATPRPDVIKRIADEIAQSRHTNPNLRIVLGHGSGSFGHASASQYQTHKGGQSPEYWRGFSKVWQSARQLNELVIAKLSDAGLPVIAFPPSSGVIAQNRMITQWETKPLRLALSHNLIPVVQGDVVFDTDLGGTILSTEQIFHFLARELKPQRILLAGSDPGVFLDPDQTQSIITHITPSTIDEILPSLTGAKAADVTGGMISKVKLMLSLVEAIPSAQVLIFSGSLPGNIIKVLDGEHLGTIISVDTQRPFSR